MRKATALLLILALCLGLGACSTIKETTSGAKESTAAPSASVPGTKAPSASAGESTAEETSTEETTEEAVKKTEIPVWTDEALLEETQKACETFLKSNSAIAALYDFTVIAVEADELADRLDATIGAGILDILNPDTEKAPGLVFFPSEMLTEVAAKGYLSPLPEQTADQKRQNTVPIALEAATAEGKLTAYPVGLGDTQLFFYNRSVLEAPSDLVTMIGILEDAEHDLLIAREYDSLPEMLFRSCGATYALERDGEGRINDIYCDYYEKGGIDVLKTLIRLKSSSWFGTDYEELPAHFANEAMPAGAAIGSAYLSDELQMVLGDDFGVSVLPCVLPDENTHMYSRGSFLLLGVNGKMREDKLDVCHKLAVALCTSNAQQARYENTGLFPVAKDLLTAGKLGDDPTAVALAEQLTMTVSRGQHSEHYESAMELFMEKLSDGAFNDKNDAYLQQQLDELCAYLMADVPKIPAEPESTETPEPSSSAETEPVPETSSVPETSASGTTAAPEEPASPSSSN